MTSQHDHLNSLHWHTLCFNDKPHNTSHRPNEEILDAVAKNGKHTCVDSRFAKRPREFFSRG